MPHATRAIIDHIDTLELAEKWGVISSVTRRAVVVNLTGVDWRVMYQALDDAGVPKGGQYLDMERGSHLCVIDRTVKMLDKDSAEVIITYGHFADAGQALQADASTPTRSMLRNVSGKMTTSIVQQDTNMYKENGQGANILILVQHTFPSDDPDKANKTESQTGQINVSIPQRTFSIEGVRRIDRPWDLAEIMIASINSTIWMGQPKHTWMCTEATWEYRVDGQYFMTFQFQHNPDTWNPDVIFIDDRTDRPPEGLIQDIGIKTIRYHREVDFVAELGFYVIGPQQGGA